MSSKYENLLESGSKNVVQSMYDNFLQSNADFRDKAGFGMTVIRESIGECCEWCSDLVGVYDYDSRPADVYARHKNCNCIVVTRTAFGTGYQDAWSRKTYDSYREARVARAEEIADEIEKDKKASEERKRLADKIRQALSEQNALSKSWLNRSRQYKTLEELKLHSSSDILLKESYSDLVQYFEKYNIQVIGFEGKTLEDVKITFAGFDDFIKEFPEAANRIKTIEYNSQLRHYGRMDSNGKCQIGPRGVGDYGTGIHEAAHAFDYELSKFGTNSFSDKIVKTARMNLGLKESSKTYSDLVTRTTGLIGERRSEEIFAYSMETEMGGLSNILTKEIFSLTKKR